jgi:hypothetical protein
VKKNEEPSSSSDEAPDPPKAVPALMDGRASGSADAVIAPAFGDRPDDMAPAICDRPLKRRGRVAEMPAGVCSLCWKKEHGKPGGTHSYVNDCKKRK